MEYKNISGNIMEYWHCTDILHLYVWAGVLYSWQLEATQASWRSFWGFSQLGLGWTGMDNDSSTYNIMMWSLKIRIRRTSNKISILWWYNQRWFLFLIFRRQQRMKSLRCQKLFCLFDLGSLRRWMVSKGTVASLWWQLPIDQTSWTMPCWDRADSIDASRWVYPMWRVGSRSWTCTSATRSWRRESLSTKSPRETWHDLAIRKEVQTIVQTTSHFCFTCLFFASFDGMLFLVSPLKAIGTAGFSGADLENLMNESAILAARRNKTATRLGKIEIDRESGLPTSKSSTIFQRRCKVFLGCIIYIYIYRFVYDFGTI